MPIQKKAPGEAIKTDGWPQWRCAQRWAAVLAVTASMITGADAQVRDTPATADQVLQKAREQLAILKALREASEQRLQEAEKRQPKILAASVLTAKPATQIDFDIGIISADLAPPESFLEIRGLPRLATMSAGKALGERSWALPMDSLSDLKMKIPADASGRFDLDLILIGNSHAVSFTSLELIIGPAFEATNNRPQAEERAEEGTLSEARGDDAGSALAVSAQPQSEAGDKRQEAALSGDNTPEPDRDAEARSDGTSQNKRLDIVETPRSEPQADPQPQRYSALQETTAAIADTRPKSMADDAQLKERAAGTQPLPLTVARERADPEAHQTGQQVRQSLGANNNLKASLAPASGLELETKLAPPATDAARVQAERLVTNGDRYLAQGNIAIARQYYLRAADLGVASAAVKLAVTYDPYEMAQLGVVGMIANPDEARRWYSRASRLGAVEAEAKLRRLEMR